MKNVPITVCLPEMINLSERELKLLLACKLYEIKEMSLGQAADVAGLSKRTFVEMLGQYGVSLFSLTEDELQRDVTNA